MKVRVLMLGLLVLGVFLLPSSITRVRASTPGLVCLADPSSAPSPPANPCPTAPGALFNGAIGQQIRIGVFLDGSAGFNGFDITLKANSTVLRPAGADLSGSILTGQPIILRECAGTFNVTGFSCAAPNNADTLQFAVVGLGATISAAATGLVFTAIYNITATSSSPISIGFQSGCVESSVSGTICVAFSNGTQIPVPETIQGASFDNRSPPPYLSVSSSSSVLGPMIVRSVSGLRLTLTGQNGWDSFLDGPATMSTVQNSSLTATFNTTTSVVPNSGSSFVTMNITGTQAGNFPVVVLVQYSVFDSVNSVTDTLVTPILVHVTVNDFAMSGSPTSVSLLPGATGSTLINASSENGFSGTVVLSTTSTSQCNLSASSLVVPGSAGSNLTCSFSPEGNYTVTVTGQNGPDVHTVKVKFVVQDFSLSSIPTIVVTNPGAAASSTVSVVSLNGFSGTITLGVTTNSTNLSCALDSSRVSGGSGTTMLSCTGSVFGNFTATVNGSSGILSHSTTVLYRVQDLVVSASPTSVTDYAGVAGVSIITVSSLNGFAGTVTLAVVTNSTSLSCGLSLASISGVLGTSNLSCTSSMAGNYLATVTGTRGILSLSATVAYHVQDFAVSANSVQASLVAGSNTSITLTVAGLNGFNHLVRVSVVSPVGLTVTPMLTSFVAPGTVGLSLTGDTAGVYQVNVTVSSDTLSHSTALNVKVTASSSSSSTLFGLAPLQFYSILAALVALSAAIVFVVVYRQRTSPAVSKPTVGKRSGKRNPK